LAAVIVGRRIDLVHIHTCSYVTFYRNVLDLAAAKLLRRAVVLHIRGGYFAHFCARAGRWRRRLIRWALEAADAVIVLSPGWRERLRPFTGHARVLVVPNGVELASVTQGRPAGNGDGRGCRFLYLSPLTEAKGLGDLLDAARQLNRDGVPFHLVIAGPAPGGPGQRAAWQRRVEGAALTEMITFAGAVGGEAKARLFAQADCFVHPSHAEGLPNTILEAAAAGLPVIATAVGGVPELMLCRAARPEGRGSASARDPGAPGPLSPLVPPHDPTSLAREMKRLACDAALRQRTAAALRERVAGHYSVSRVADRVGRVYRAVLALRRGRQRCPERCLPQGKRFLTPFPAAKCGRSVEQVETARIGAP
jgi:glycosyltransferase involved in cell wall biosynthesis